MVDCQGKKVKICFINALLKLKQDGYKVRWYCVGEGNARDEYEKLIKEKSGR